MDWLAVLDWGLAGLAFVIVALVCAFLIRRRWLSRRGGLFECSVRLRPSTPGTGWVLGVARYSGERLEWYPIFNLSFRPWLTFVRARTRASAQRQPDAVEAVDLYDHSRIVRLDTVGADADNRGGYELALPPHALTGLLSWLEAAPPGQRYHAPER